tara:strand:- start:1986 stop:3389 length:1404 start_codon:yes stop_codon:yes gene_type:complete
MAIGDTVNAGLMRTDFSAFQQAGQAKARASEAFGNAVGNFIEGHYKKKKEKEDRQERKNFYLAQGFNEEEATAASGDKDLGKFLERKREAEWREGEADRNFELAKSGEQRLADSANFTQGRLETADQLVADKTLALEKFGGDLLSEAMDPEVARQVEEVRPGMFALGNEGQRNRFLDYQQEQQPKVAVGELGSADFAKVARGEGFDPTLAAGRFMDLQKVEQAVAKESTGKLGDQFSSRLPALQPYYFSDSDATNAVSNEATKLGITLNKDQLAQAVSKQKVIPTKDLRSAADTRFSKLNLDEPRTILDAADDLESFLDEGGVLSGKVAKEKLARMVQPAGILTEDDLRRMGTSSAFMDSLNTLIEEKKTGKIDGILEGYLRSTTKVFRQRAQQVLKEKTDYTVNSLSNNFGITPEEVRKYTQFGGIMYGFDQPSSQGPQQGQPPQDPSVQSPSTLPGGGIFTPISQ